MVLLAVLSYECLAPSSSFYVHACHYATYPNCCVPVNPHDKQMFGPWVVWQGLKFLHLLSGSGLVMFLALQAPAGPQGEQDGTGNWRGMLKKGEEAPGSGPGSPLKGAVNLLDVVTQLCPISMSLSEDLGVFLY